MRSFSWYSDNFELDQSSLFLHENCEKWAKALRDNKIELAALELVPAAKTSKWLFVESRTEGDAECLVWQPENNADLALRPLAHIGIKEQAYFTLLMTYLANTVETRQGDPATKFDNVHEMEVAYYGNRLYCTYNDDEQAEHNYGSTIVYSKYFIDYRRFLQRPYYFAQQASTEKLPNEDRQVFTLKSMLVSALMKPSMQTARIHPLIFKTT